MHENAARALQYYEDLPRRSGRPDLRLVEPDDRPRRAARAEEAPAAEVRTIRVEARRTAPPRHREPAARRTTTVRRRQSVAPRIAGRPDRVAMWAVMLGFFLTGVAAATGHG